MYGKHVEITIAEGVTAKVWVLGTPELPAEEWKRRAMQILMNEVMKLVVNT